MLTLRPCLLGNLVTELPVLMEPPLSKLQPAAVGDNKRGPWVLIRRLTDEPFPKRPIYLAVRSLPRKFSSSTEQLHGDN